MHRAKNALILVVCAALWSPLAPAQGGSIPESLERPAGAVEIVRFEMEHSYAHLEPAQFEGRPGIAVVFTGTDDMHYYARSETAPAPGLDLKLEASSDELEFSQAVLPAWGIFDDPTGKKVEVYAGRFAVFLPIREESIPAGAQEADVAVRIAGIACTSQICLPPFEKTLTTSLRLDEMAAWPAISIEDAQVAAVSSPPAETATRSSGAAIYYLLAVVAGLSINIMPCVLPVLPLILLRLVDHSRQSGKRSVAPGVAFCAGILLFFAAFALLAAIIHLTTGAVLDLNSLFRYPAAVIVLFLAIVFFGLVMLDVVTLTLPSSIASRQGGGSGTLGSVGMGFFAGVLSTPCSGALLGFVLVWAQTQPLAVSSTAILLMGVGMALPYGAIILAPSLLDRIPKPGHWMDLFKKSTGFLLFLIAGHLTLAALPKERLLNVLTFGIIFSFCVWMWGKWVDFSTPASRRSAIRIIAVVVAVTAGMWLLPARIVPPEASLDWRAYDPGLVQQAVARQQPVVLKFTADWCTNCKVVERRVYQDPTVVEMIRKRGVLPIMADTTVIDYPATRDLKEVYGEAGNVPVSIVLLPDDSREKLRGIFDKQDLIRILATLPENDQ